MEAEQLQLRAVQERAARASLELQGEHESGGERGDGGAAAELAQLTRMLAEMQRGAEPSEAEGLLMELQALRAEQRELALLEQRASPQRAAERGSFEREERAAIVEQRRLYGEVRVAEEEKAATLRVHAAVSPFRKRAEKEAIATEERERMLARLAELEGMRDQYHHLEQAAQVRELVHGAPAPAPAEGEAMSPSRRLAIGVEGTHNVRAVSEEIAAFREQQRSVVESSFPVTELSREIAAFREQQRHNASEVAGALPPPPPRARRAEGEPDQLALELAQLQQEQSVLHAQSFQLQNAKSRGAHGGAHGGRSAGVMDEEALLLEEQRQLLMQMESFNSERALIEKYERVRRSSPTRSSPTRTSPGRGAARGRAPGSTPLPTERRTRRGAPVGEIVERETRRMQEEQARAEREHDVGLVESRSWASAPNTPEDVGSAFLSVRTSASRGGAASPLSPTSGWETTPGGSRRPKTSRRVPNPSPTEFSDYIAGRSAPPLTAELAHRAGIKSPMALSTADGVLSMPDGGTRGAPGGDGDVHAMVKGLLRRDDGIATLVSALASGIDAGGNSDENAAIAERLLRALTRPAARDSEGEASGGEHRGAAFDNDDDDDDDDDVSDGDNQADDVTSSASASELGGESGRGDALHQITAALLAEFSPPAYEPLVEGMDPWQQHEDDAASASAPIDSCVFVCSCAASLHVGCRHFLSARLGGPFSQFFLLFLRFQLLARNALTLPRPSGTSTASEPSPKWRRACAWRCASQRATTTTRPQAHCSSPPPSPPCSTPRCRRSSTAPSSAPSARRSKRGKRRAPAPRWSASAVGAKRCVVHFFLFTRVYSILLFAHLFFLFAHLFRSTRTSPSSAGTATTRMRGAPCSACGGATAARASATSRISRAAK